MTAEEHHQQELEQQQYEADMKAAAGSPDLCQCSACNEFGVVNTWTAEGFEIRFGKDAMTQLLETDYVALCPECEHVQEWNETEAI